MLAAFVLLKREEKEAEEKHTNRAATTMRLDFVSPHTSEFLSAANNYHLVVYVVLAV